MMTWLRVWKWLNHLLSLIGALAVIVVVVFWVGSIRSKVKRVLPEYPDAVWRGAEDGGDFIEITRSRRRTISLRFAQKAAVSSEKAGCASPPTMANR